MLGSREEPDALTASHTHTHTHTRTHTHADRHTGAQTHSSIFLCFKENTHARVLILEKKEQKTHR